jgi:hypothetical protein
MEPYPLGLGNKFRLSYLVSEFITQVANDDTDTELHILNVMSCRVHQKNFVLPYCILQPGEDVSIGNTLTWMQHQFEMDGEMVAYLPDGYGYVIVLDPKDKAEHIQHKDFYALFYRKEQKLYFPGAGEIGSALKVDIGDLLSSPNDFMYDIGHLSNVLVILQMPYETDTEKGSRNSLKRTSVKYQQTVAKAPPSYDQMFREIDAFKLMRIHLFTFPEFDELNEQTVVVLSGKMLCRLVKLHIGEESAHIIKHNEDNIERRFYDIFARFDFQDFAGFKIEATELDEDKNAYDSYDSLRKIHQGGDDELMQAIISLFDRLMEDGYKEGDIIQGIDEAISETYVGEFDAAITPGLNFHGIYLLLDKDVFHKQVIESEGLETDSFNKHGLPEYKLPIGANVDAYLEKFLGDDLSWDDKSHIERWNLHGKSMSEVDEIQYEFVYSKFEEIDSGIVYAQGTTTAGFGAEFPIFIFKQDRRYSVIAYDSIFGHLISTYPILGKQTDNSKRLMITMIYRLAKKENTPRDKAAELIAAWLASSHPLWTINKYEVSMFSTGSLNEIILVHQSIELQSEKLSKMGFEREEHLFFGIPEFVAPGTYPRFDNTEDLLNHLYKNARRYTYNESGTYETRYGYKGDPFLFGGKSILVDGDMWRLNPDIVGNEAEEPVAVGLVKEYLGRDSYAFDTGIIRINGERFLYIEGFQVDEEW